MGYGLWPRRGAKWGERKRDVPLRIPQSGVDSAAAYSLARRVQPEPDPATIAGCGHTARAEKPHWQACFVRLFTFPGSDKPESALQTPSFRVRCRVLRESAYPATSSALHKTHHLRHGLLVLLCYKLDTLF